MRANPTKNDPDAVFDALIDKADEFAELVEPLKLKQYTVGMFRRNAQ